MFQDDRADAMEEIERDGKEMEELSGNWKWEWHC
jgi:hypothetical protein